jgi:putative addiction module component (TIGR02574 family)
MTTNLIETAKSLSLPERIELLDALWESIVEDGYEPALTDAQATELDRRLKAYQDNPNEVVDWETTKAGLETKLGKR